MNRQRRWGRSAVSLLAVGLFLFTATARADSISATVIGVTTRDFKFVLNGDHVDSPYTGALTWQRNSGSTAFGNTFQTFCIDLMQYVTFNPPNSPSYPFTLTPLQNAPWDNVQHNTSMGLAKAKLLSELWNTYHSQVVNDDTSAAFQIAVWEIVFEDSNNAHNLLNGGFTADYGTSSVPGYVKIGNMWVPTYVKTAQTWLTSLTGTAPLDPHLVALTSDTAQDQFTFTNVPAPPGVFLAGIGGLGLMIGGWRRRES